MENTNMILGQIHELSSNNNFYKQVSQIIKQSQNKKDVGDYPFIKVYEFDNAPSKLRDLSTNGGDEDWIAVVPKSMLDNNDGYIGWIESYSFGCCCVDRYELDSGDTVFIGCHA